MRTMKHLLPLGALCAMTALPAFAETEGHGEGFMGGLAYSASDPVTFVAFLAPATCVNALPRRWPMLNAASRTLTRKLRP